MSKLDSIYRKHNGSSGEWKHVSARAFWGSTASPDHIVQIYEDDEVFITSAASFVGEGINANENCVVICTPEHLAALEKKLEQHGMHVDALINDNRYIPLDAEEMLSRYMVDDWPDKPLLYLTASEIVSTARAGGRKIRCMGEMVYLLWERGLKEAALQVEEVWGELHEQDPFLIFCGYRRSSFQGDIYNYLSKICCVHHKIIAGIESRLNEVVYRDIDREREESERVLLAR